MAHSCQIFTSYLHRDIRHHLNILIIKTSDGNHLQKYMMINTQSITCRYNIIYLFLRKNRNIELVDMRNVLSAICNFFKDNICTSVMLYLCRNPFSLCPNENSRLGNTLSTSYLLTNELILHRFCEIFRKLNKYF